jgi:hypothetical protein
MSASRSRAVISRSGTTVRSSSTTRGGGRPSRP